jgi:hypothetical protein
MPLIIRRAIVGHIYPRVELGLYPLPAPTAFAPGVVGFRVREPATPGAKASERPLIRHAGPVTMPPPPSAKYADEWYSGPAASPCAERIATDSLGPPPGHERTARVLVIAERPS